MVFVGGAFLLPTHENFYMQVHKILIVCKLQKGEKWKFLYSNNTAGKYYRHFIKIESVKLKSKNHRILELPSSQWINVDENFHDSMATVCQWLNTHMSYFWASIKCFYILIHYLYWGYDLTKIEKHWFYKYQITWVECIITRNQCENFLCITLRQLKDWNFVSVQRINKW